MTCNIQITIVIIGGMGNLLGSALAAAFLVLLPEGLRFIGMPNEFRMSAITTLNPLIISGFPSTIVTPLPTCVWSFPSAASIKPIMKSVLIASTILAAAGGA